MVKHVTIDLPELHSNQVKILSEHSRFNVLCCGRRWGKTVLCEDLLLAPDDPFNGALAGFPVAYAAPTFSGVMDVWRQVTSTLYEIIQSTSEQEKRIELMGGGVIQMFSMDAYDRIRGKKFKRFVIDEAAASMYLEEAWNKVIRATLTDLEGDAWFLSTPRGRSNYFYDLSENATRYPDWRTWQMPTSANPHMKASEIEAARLQLDPLTFAQEYLASFVTENLNAFAYAFSRETHIAPTRLQKGFEVYLSFDFNRDPITCAVFQHVVGKILGIEQIKLANSNIYQLCDYITAKYGRSMFIITGDATGRNRSALVSDNSNYYTVIRSKLELSLNQIKVPSVNPSVEENRVLVNSALHSMDIKLDPINCAGLIFDLEYASVLPDGSLDKSSRTDATKQLDALDCFRYYLNTFHSHILKIGKPT